MSFQLALGVDEVPITCETQKLVYVRKMNKR